MIEAGRIVSVWRYPVKSMAGERVASADLTSLGVHADRTWAVRDVEHATPLKIVDAHGNELR